MNLNLKIKLPIKKLFNSNLINKYNRLCEQRELITNEIEYVKKEMLERGVAYIRISDKGSTTIPWSSYEKEIEKVVNLIYRKEIRKFVNKIKRTHKPKQYFKIKENINFKK
tara:strand:- start:673 stop:1005 length:333 start_codon:yes stop_codon:yes gene_type:complete